MDNLNTNENPRPCVRQGQGQRQILLGGFKIAHSRLGFNAASLQGGRSHDAKR